MGEEGRCVRRSLRVASALGTIWQVGLTQNSLDPLTIFFDPNCEDPLVWLRSCCGARNDAPRRSGAHGRTRAQRDASHLSVLAQKISGGAGTGGAAKRREGTHAKEVKYSSNEKKVDLIIALSAHRGSSGLSSAGAPHLPLPVPHVVLGDDCAAQAVVIRGATQARLVLEQLLAHRLLHRH